MFMFCCFFVFVILTTLLHLVFATLTLISSLIQKTFALFVFQINNVLTRNWIEDLHEFCTIAPTGFDMFCQQ